MRGILEKDVEIKYLREQLGKTNLVNLKFGKSEVDLEKIISHQRDPTNRRCIIFESNQKYIEHKCSKEQEVEGMLYPQ